MKLKKLVNTSLAILLMSNLCFAFVQFDIEIKEVKAQEDAWYWINDSWINVTTTDYFNMSIQRSRNWIKHYYWKNRTSGEWVDIYDGGHPLVQTETEVWQYKCPNSESYILLKTSDVLVVASNASRWDWNGTCRYVFWKDVPWFLADIAFIANDNTSVSIQADVFGNADKFGKDSPGLCGITENGTTNTLSTGAAQFPLPKNNSQQEFPWFCYRNSKQNWTMGFILADIYPRFGYWKALYAGLEVQLTAPSAFNRKGQIYRTKWIIYPHLTDGYTNDNYYQKTRDLAQDLFSSVCIERYYDTGSWFAAVNFEPDGGAFIMQNNYVLFGEHPEVDYSIGSLVHRTLKHYTHTKDFRYANSTKNTLRDCYPVLFDSYESVVLYPDYTYPPSYDPPIATTQQSGNWTVASDKVILEVIQNGSTFEVTHTITLHSHSDKAFANVTIKANKDLNITQVGQEFWFYGGLLETSYNAESHAVNGTIRSYTYFNHDLGKNCSLVYMARDCNDTYDYNDWRWFARPVHWTTDHQYNAGDTICTYQIVAWFTEDYITQPSQVNLDTDVFMDTKFLIGHNWFWRDLENKTSTSDFRFYTNSTMIKTVYTTDNLTIQALGSEKDGSGTDLMLVYLADKGQPTRVKLGGKSVSYSYNATTKIVSFDVTYSGVETIEIRWGDNPPTLDSQGHNTTTAGASCNFYSRWEDDNALSYCIFGTNVTGSWQNETHTLTSNSDWCNVTKTLPSRSGIKVGYQFWANDSADQWTNSNLQSFTTTVAGAPTYSNIGYNMTLAGHVTLLSCLWQDGDGLSHVVFSWNGTGSWANDTASGLTGTTDWANATKTLPSNVGVVVGFRWYCNDTGDNWGETGIHTLTTTSSAAPHPFIQLLMDCITYNALILIPIIQTAIVLTFLLIRDRRKHRNIKLPQSKNNTKRESS